MRNLNSLSKFVGLSFMLFFISLATSQAQTSYYFYVQFVDKKNTPYSLSNPSQYLSERAISRRIGFGLKCDSTDLPVNPSYLQQIRNIGIPVHNISKWMNSATVLLTDSSLMSQVRGLPFVKFVEYTGKLEGAAFAPPSKVSTKKAFDYGVAEAQISQLDGKNLHNEGYRGKGIQIGVIDAGFTNVNINPAFDSLRLQGRLLGTKDIINPMSNIYNEDSHGAMVLATMTGNLPGKFLGTAPDASFWLIRTEYGPTEYKVETDFWASGIEFADSVGVDVVNSSLGYSTFDDPKMNFTYSDMNGKVSRASRAANLASKKGIIVLVSAGNDGNSNWHYIDSPADADGIIAVGSVNSIGTSSVFSSFGPSSDGRVKPEVCALGTAASVVNISGVPTFGSGTSFSTPIMAGMIACLLQRYKAMNTILNVTTLLNAVFKSGSLYNNPTEQKGYGIPDFANVEQNLRIFDSLFKDGKNDFIIAYNSFFKTINIRFIDGINPINTIVRIYTISGSLIVNQSITDSSFFLKTDKLAPGIYAVCVSENGNTDTKKIIIQ